MWGKMGIASIPVQATGQVRRYAGRVVRALDRRITADRLRNYPLIIMVVGSLGLVGSSVIRLIDPSVHGAFLPDYLAHWTGGAMLFSGDHANLYDPQKQYTFQAETTGGTTRLAWFVSPPVVAAFYSPLTLLAYAPSGLVWFLLSSLMLVWCTLSLAELAPALMQRRRGIVFLAVLASPPVFEMLGGGQDSVFVLAMWLVALRLLAAWRTVPAGAILGMGCAKPQFVVLVPVILLATRNYRALAAFAGVFSVLLVASVGLVGVEGMQRWAQALASPLYMEQVQHGQTWKMVSLPAFALALVPPAWGHSFTAILTGSALLIGASLLLLRIHKVRHLPLDALSVGVATLATTLVFSPHLAIYDAVLFIPVVIYLIERRPTPSLRVSTAAAFGLMWLAPVLHMAADALPPAFAVIDAPWSALPLTVIWLESLRNLKLHETGAGEGREPIKAGPPFKHWRNAVPRASRHESSGF